MHSLEDCYLYMKMHGKHTIKWETLIFVFKYVYSYAIRNEITSCDKISVNYGSGISSNSFSVASAGCR